MISCNRRRTFDWFNKQIMINEFLVSRSLHLRKNEPTRQYFSKVIEKLRQISPKKNWIQNYLAVWSSTYVCKAKRHKKIALCAIKLKSNQIYLYSYLLLLIPICSIRLNFLRGITNSSSENWWIKNINIWSKYHDTMPNGVFESRAFINTNLI